MTGGGGFLPLPSIFAIFFFWKEDPFSREEKCIHWREFKVKKYTEIQPFNKKQKTETVNTLKIHYTKKINFICKSACRGRGHQAYYDGQSSLYNQLWFLVTHILYFTGFSERIFISKLRGQKAYHDWHTDIMVYGLLPHLYLRRDIVALKTAALFKEGLYQLESWNKKFIFN